MRYQSTILACFASWKVVPEAIRGDPASVDRYARTLMYTADLFRSLGHPELLESLSGKRDNPITRWQEQLTTATELGAAGEFERSTALLQGILQAMEGMSGTAIDHVRPKILGLLSTNALNTGDFGASQDYAERARAGCERIGDRDGVRIYRENLQILRAVQAKTGAPGAATGLTRILTAIAEAQDLSDSGRYLRSNAILHDLWTSLAQGQEQLGEDYLGKVYGLMGSNYFKLQDAQLARDFTEMALRECKRLGDDYGAMIYASNREVISRKPAAERHEQ